ncbi:MAG: hypothetical protein IJE08_04435 [Clostridia bacterium]|nr:hypothetical protein [Clostridia bacterium]
MGFRRLRIAGFAGIDTQKGDFHENLSTSPDAVNFICENGAMRTAKGTEAYAPVLPLEGARLFQAFFRDDETQEDRERLMASGGGCLYALMDGGWVQIGAGYASDDWRAVNYRSEDRELILLVNGSDHIAAWDGKSAGAEAIVPVQGGDEIAFEHLTLLYERLWGAVHAQAPDRVYWSESFMPEDWEVNYDTPDAGGGFIDVATFDGSRIRAIVAAFDDVLIFKDKSMHRLNGTYPGEFSLTQVYGSEGTLAARTIVHTADRLYFLGSDGLCVYNGMSVSTLAHAGERKLTKIFERMNRAAIRNACAAIHGDTMYLALPLDGAEENSHVVEYRLSDGVCSVVTLGGVKDWLVKRDASGDRLLCLIGRMVYEYGKGRLLAGETIEARWTSPVVSMGTISARRTAGRIYLTVEAEEDGAAIILTMIGDGVKRSMRIELKKGVNLIRPRIRVRGRTFRFRIENADGCSLTLPDGMEILMEEDSDL